MMKLIYQASNIIEAHLVAGLLQSEGIESHVCGHYLQGAVGDLCATGFANILIAEADCDKARQLIQEYETNTAEEE